MNRSINDKTILFILAIPTVIFYTANHGRSLKATKCKVDLLDEIFRKWKYKTLQETFEKLESTSKQEIEKAFKMRACNYLHPKYQES